MTILASAALAALYISLSSSFAGPRQGVCQGGRQTVVGKCQWESSTATHAEAAPGGCRRGVCRPQSSLLRLFNWRKLRQTSKHATTSFTSTHCSAWILLGVRCTAEGGVQGAEQLWPVHQDAAQVWQVRCMTPSFHALQASSADRGGHQERLAGVQEHNSEHMPGSPQSPDSFRDIGRKGGKEAAWPLETCACCVHTGCCL